VINESYKLKDSKNEFLLMSNEHLFLVKNFKNTENLHELKIENLKTKRKLKIEDVCQIVIYGDEEFVILVSKTNLENNFNQEILRFGNHEIAYDFSEKIAQKNNLREKQILPSIWEINKGYILSILLFMVIFWIIFQYANLFDLDPNADLPRKTSIFDVSLIFVAKTLGKMGTIIAAFCVFTPIVLRINKNLKNPKFQYIFE
jgi:hypothetical protein